MSKTRELVWMAVFAVLIAVCAWISIPTAIPFTMQTFAVYLALNFLGTKNGIGAIGIYLLMGSIGLPVFSNFTSGIGVLLGTHGGYMTGWIFSGLMMGAVKKLLGRKLWAQAVSMVLGLAVCYVMGTAWFLFIYSGSTGAVGLGTALLWCVVPFIFPDLIKLGLALWMSQKLEQIQRSL